MKTISVVTSKTKRNLYFIVILLYFVISVFFIINSEYQYRSTKKTLISEAIQKSSVQVNQCVDIIASSLAQSINLVVHNQKCKTAILTNDSFVIHNSVEPIITKLTESQNTFFAIYTESGSQLYNNSEIPFHTNLASSINLGDDGFFSHFITNDSTSLYFAKLRKISLNGSNYHIFSGIKDTDAAKSICSKSGILPFIIFHDGIQSKPVIAYNSEETVNAILNKAGNLRQSNLLKEIKIGDAYYVLADATSAIFPEIPAVFNVYFAVDITEYAKNYTTHLQRIFIFVFAFLIVVLLIVRLFHNKIINNLLSLEEKLEIQLASRTREVIDHNEQLNQIFNATTNGIRIIDKNFTVIKVNSAFCQLTGMKCNDLVGVKCYDKFPSTSCHTSNCPLEIIKQEGAEVRTIDTRYNVLEKKIVCQYNAKPFLTKDGDLIGIIEDFKDITELYNAKEAIKQTQKQYESLHDSMPVGIFVRDFEGNMHYQNTYMNKVFGPVHEGRRNLSAIYPSQLNRFFEEDKVVERYGAFVGEEKLIDTNGIERTYVTHKFKFLGVNNKPLIGGVSIDITKRKKAEHNSYVLTKAIVNSPIGVLITSPQGIVEFFNPEFEKFSGKASEKIMGSTFPYSSNSNTLTDIVKAARNGVVYQGELQLDLFSNEQKWYALSVAPVFNNLGIVAHLVFTLDDITERKEHERQIVIAKLQAEESDRLKTAFLSNLSHEIRTPLNAILGFSSLLGCPNISNAEREEIPELLVNHSNDLLELINDLIDISAIETDQLSVNNEECQLNNTLTETFNEVITKNRFIKKSKVKTNIKLGILEDKFTILTDAKRLSQVVAHLLSNAIKFTSSGFIELGYTLKDPNNLLFYVIDSGVGFTAEEKSIIFSPFRQADDSITRHYSGMGLGLAISKHIIERLGGEIWVDSVKNQGSTFYFTIPYVPVKTKFDNAFLSLKENELFNWNNKTILVADDIDSNFKFIRTLLKPTGANLIWAKNGQEAVDMVKSTKIDLILMDVVMPEVDGFEATRQIKLIDSNIKVICQTAYPEEHTKDQIQKCGMDRYLSKPIAPFCMLKTINEFISPN